MRSVASRESIAGAVAVLVLLFGGERLSAEKTGCKCPKPPGGSHGCEDQQVAYCEVKDGECVGWCGSVKTTRKRGEELAAAILSESLKHSITPEDLQEGAEYHQTYLDFLQSGSFPEGTFEVAKGSKEIFLQVPSQASDRIADLKSRERDGDIRPYRGWRRWGEGESGEQVADASITAAIKAKLTADGDINPFNIDVDTNEGVVTLQGRVEKAEARSKAEQLARDTDGVRRVVNLIKVGDRS